MKISIKINSEHFEYFKDLLKTLNNNPVLKNKVAINLDKVNEEFIFALGLDSFKNIINTAKGMLTAEETGKEVEVSCKVDDNRIKSSIKDGSN